MTTTPTPSPTTERSRRRWTLFLIAVLAVGGGLLADGTAQLVVARLAG